jgi:CDP-diacylglycerol--glycerol-3-phosphate 3-phosphatidyltransferase
MTLATYFTLLRILLSPLFPILYLSYQSFSISFELMPYLLLILLVLSEGSDVVDGMVARRLNQVTDLGKILDPIADTITHVSLFLTFTQGFVQLPLLLVLVFLYRDMFVTTLRSLCALKGFALAARTSGKVKAILQAVVAFLIVLSMIPLSLGMLSLDHFQRFALVTTSFAAFYTALSMVDYLYANWSYIRKAIAAQM